MAEALRMETAAPEPPSDLPLEDLTWPFEDLGDAIVHLAAELGAEARVAPLPSPNGLSGADLDRWMDDAAAWVGVEAEAVHVTGADVDGFAAAAGPAILRVGRKEHPRLLVLRAGDWRGARVLGPDLRTHRVDGRRVADALLAGLEGPVLGNVEQALSATGLSGKKREKVRGALLRIQVSARRIGAGWILRLPPSATVARQARSIAVPSRLGWLSLGHILDYLLGLAGWWMIGQGALAGRLEGSWLFAWALLELTLVPVRAALVRAEGRLALDAGALLKQRLLLGALRLQPEEVRHQGMGQLLGRVIESENVESLAMSGGLLSFFAAIELLLGVGVLAAGAGGTLHGALLAIWGVAVVAGGWLYYRRRSQWSDARLDMTNALVESLVGHRTRLAQEDPARWHDGEDGALARYVGASGRMDRAVVTLEAVGVGGWIVAGLLGLAPALLAGTASGGALAVSVGGVILAYGSLRKLVTGLSSMSGAGIAWEQVRELFWAATRAEPATPPSSRPSARGSDGMALLEAHGLTFRHAGRDAAVFAGVELVIRPGDHLLLEGPSGGGKSTLGSVLAGLRTPGAGLLVLGGLDRRTLGPEGWRRRVVTAPQFHENHVLGSPLAFNLLMGRTWPPGERDMQDAEALCRELGLGDLLERMPAGIMQMVGETGWQLSHGEKSRLYIARALLQGADLVVLDESFAALDPDNLRRALKCVLARARAVLVIAHP